jgi:methionyl-tRNA formyltransferase
MGTPDFAVPTLAEIVGHGHEVVAVYTRAPAKAGRGMELRPSPVQVMAERLSLPVLTPVSLRNEEAVETFRAHQADVAVVVAYGMLLPKHILDVPILGCLNLHGSLLPRWRGAAPIQRAVMAGDEATGVAVMKMEAGLDTGPVAMVEPLMIDGDMTAGDVHDRLMALGADLMARALAALSRDALSFVAQPEQGVTYAKKITNEDARIDWMMSAQAVHNHVRGLSPFPGAYTMIDLGKGEERVKVLRTLCVPGVSGTQPGTMLDDEGMVACGEGAIRLVQVQRAGKGPVTAEEFLRGARLEAGTRLI